MRPPHGIEDHARAAACPQTLPQEGDNPRILPAEDLHLGGWGGKRYRLCMHGRPVRPGEQWVGAFFLQRGAVRGRFAQVCLHQFPPALARQRRGKQDDRRLVCPKPTQHRV